MLTPENAPAWASTEAPQPDSQDWGAASFSVRREDGEVRVASRGAWRSAMRHGARVAVRKASGLCLVALILGMATAARAGDESTRTRAQAYIDLASRLFAAHDYAAALTELERAAQLEDLVVLRFNIARCHDELGHAVQAVREFEHYLEMTDDTEGAADRHARALATIERLSKSAVGVLDVRCQGRVEVVGVTETPQPCPLERLLVVPGTLELRVAAEGFEPYSQKVSVAAGEHVKLEPVLVPSTRAQNPALLDKGTGTTVSATAGPRPMRVAGWVLFGVGLAEGLATGIGFGATGASQHDQASRAGLASDAMNLESDAETKRDLAIGLGIGGAVIAAVGAGLLVADLRSADGDRAGVAIGAGPGRIGLCLHFQ
jgi:hypothetical protein